MPGFDGTGPRGMGPMTGGGRGFCNPLATGSWGGVNPWLGYQGYSPRPGYGYTPHPWGPGRYWPSAWSQPPAAPWYTPPGPTYGASPGVELDFLTNQASMLQQQMDQIQKRIEEIEKQEKPKKK